MGPLTRAERLLLAVFSLVLLLWLASEWIALRRPPSRGSAWRCCLLTRVLEWKDILDEKGAWDALIWFGGLVMLRRQLDKAGFPQAFAHAAAGSSTAGPGGGRSSRWSLSTCTPTTHSRAWWRT